MIGQGLQLPGVAPQALLQSYDQPVMAQGLVRMESAASMIRSQTAAAVARAQAAAAQPAVTGLAGYVQSCWTKAKMSKLSIEQDMLRAVRAKKGEYDPQKLALIREQGGSEIYMMLFSTKARQASALIKDVMIGAGTEKPWTLKPDPKPDISPELIAQVAQEALKLVMQAETSGLPLSPDDIRQMLKDYRDKVQSQTMEIARERCGRMEDLMETQTVEGGWIEGLEEFIDDLAVFKTAFLKGPVIRKRTKAKWVAQPPVEGQPQGYELTLIDDLSLEWERVDPFMIYPAGWSRDVNDAFLIERHKMQRGDLSALIGVEGYSEDAIRAVLDQFGDTGLHDWLMIDTARMVPEGRSPTQAVQTADTIDAIQFWGPVSGKRLLEWGMDPLKVTDPAKEYEAEVWQIGPHTIKAAINADPLKRRPYYGTGYERVPGAFWHNSLYDTIADVCDMCNGAARALANNLGIASGPQVQVNVDRLPAGEKITQMFPWKLWQTLSDPNGGTSDAIKFFQPQSNAQELMMVYQQFSVMADEQSGIPRYMTGGDAAGGAGRTASGLSMMLSNASKTIKAVIGNIDLNVIDKSINRLYFYNMRYSDNPDLKGAVNVMARGALSLISKETAQVRVSEFLARTANPLDQQIMGPEGRAYLLRENARTLSLDTDKVVPNESVVKVRQLLAQQQSQQQQLSDNAIQAGQTPATGGPGGTGGPPSAPQPPMGPGQALMNGAPQTDNFSPTPAGG